MADIKIASMVEATSITDTDLIVVEDSADTKKITKANFKETMGINDKAPQATTYTKTEIDASLLLKANNVQESWNALTLVNSWVNFGDGFFTARYRKTTIGTVEVEGFIKNGVSGTVGTLPVGYRPTLRFRVPAIGATTFGYLDIGADGIIRTNVSGTDTYVSLKITFTLN